MITLLRPARFTLSLALCCLLGCRSSPVLPPAGEQAPAQPSATPNAPPAPNGASPGTQHTAQQRRGDGCWGKALPAEPAARLETLGARCAQGMKPLFASPRTLTPDARELPLPALGEGACLRAAAVSSSGPITLVLLDGSGQELARDADRAFALLSPAGPLCPRRGEGLRVRVELGAGATDALVQLWSTAAP